VPDGVFKCDAPLPSADESGRESPVSVMHLDHGGSVFQIASIDCDAVVDADPVLDDFFGSSGHTDPFSSSPDGDADNNCLMDLDIETSDLAPANLPWMSGDYLGHELLTKYADTVDPGMRALNALSFLLCETKMSRNEHYDMMHKEEALLSNSSIARGHMDGGSMATTTN